MFPSAAARPLIISLPLLHQTAITCPRATPLLSFAAAHSSAFTRPFCTRTDDFHNSRLSRPKHPALHWALESSEADQQTPHASTWAKHPALHWAVPATNKLSITEEPAVTEPAKETNKTAPDTAQHHSHLVSPDGTRRFWRIGDPHCGMVFLQKSDDKPVAINITGYGECFWHPDSRHILQNQVQQGGNIHVVQYDTDVPALTGHDMTPWPDSTARIVHSTSNGDWLTPIQIIANKRNNALFDFYTSQGNDVHNDGSVVQWFTKDDGRLGGRVRSVNGEYLFEVAEAKTNSMYGNPELHFSEVYRWTEGRVGKDGGQGSATIKWNWHGFSALRDPGGKHLHVNDHPIRRSTLPGTPPAGQGASIEKKQEDCAKKVE
jgi:hypothetical protein